MDLEVATTLADLVSVDALVTSKGRIIYGNPSCRARAIATRGWEDLKGHHLWDLFDEEQSTQVKDWYTELSALDDRFGILVLKVRSTDAPDETEKLIAMKLMDRELVVFRTPDSRPIMERLSELETMTLMFKSYLHDGGLGLMILQDEDKHHGVIRYISPEGANILDRDASDVLGLELSAFVVNEERAGVMEWYRTRTRHDQAEACREVRFLDPSDEGLLLDLVIGGTTWNGQPAMYCLFRDETAKAIMIEELRRFAQGFEMLNDTMVLADRDFNIIYVNPEGLRRSGYAFEEVLGKPAYMFAANTDDEMDPLELARTLFDSGHWTGERTAMTKDGMRYPVEIAVSMRVDPKGDPDMVTVISRDISERKAAERNIMRARERAEFFTDLLAHDINNYIQGVIGFLDLLTKEDIDPSRMENVERAKEQASRVSELIDRVRTISKAQQAEELKPVDMATVVHEAVADVTRNHSRRNARIEVHGAEGPVMVMADDLLHDLVLNLLDNAVKYASDPEAPVEVRLERRPFERTEAVRLSVADHGPGVPDEDKTSIFFRFVRRVEGGEGSGLGLSLVLALADRYQGRAWVEDRVPGSPGEGARFFVELPAA